MDVKVKKRWDIETQKHSGLLWDCALPPGWEIGYFKHQQDQIRKTHYHTFELEERLITLCVVVTGSLNVGYSVKLPEDKPDKELGKKISLGRALKKPLSSTSVNEYSEDRGVLKAVALFWERKLKKDPTKYIKGLI